MRAPGGGTPRRAAGRKSSTGNELAAAGSARNVAYGPLPTAMRPSSGSANQLAWPLPLQFRTLAHDDLGPDRNPVVEIHDVPIHQAEAARRNRMADRLRLIGAVDAVDRVAEIKGTRPERIARAAGHEPRQIRLAVDHLRRRDPIGPFGLARNAQQPRPLEAVAADPDPVAQRPVIALHEIEKALRRADDDGSGRLGGAEEHQLPLVRGGQPLLVRIRHDAGLLLDGQFLGLQAHGTLRLRLLAGSPAGQEPPDAQPDRDSSTTPLHPFPIRPAFLGPSPFREPSAHP